MNEIWESIIAGFCRICGVILLASVFGILGYVLYKGIGVIDLSLIFGKTDIFDAIMLKKQVFDGLFPAIAGTMMLVMMSVILAVPIGIAGGIYLAEYAQGLSRKVFGLLPDILAGIPSIVIGLFGFSITIFLNRYWAARIYPCLFISSLCLALLVLPYIIRTTQAALEGLPEDIRLTAIALGATKLQNIRYVLIPKSLPGIFSGIILAVGRCAEDTAVIMLTGVVASAGVPKSLFSNYEALPFYIYYISSQYSDPSEMLTGYGASVILLLICIFFFMISFAIRRGLTYRSLYRV
jgi:phosphate transport system permease protein